LPVESLKIEGRMKSPEYVAIVTSIYRKALDAIAKGAWSPSIEDERDLALAFNRDFTAGHLLSAKDIMGRQMSDNRGVLIGSVASFDSQRGEVAVRLVGPMIPEEGDGLVFIAPGQETGLVVHKPWQKDGLFKLRTPQRVRPGAKVYLTGSTALDRRARQIISSAKTEIPLDLHISWDERTPVAEARLEGGVSVGVRAGFKMDKAISQPTTAQQIEAQLRRTGGTPFLIRKVVMDYPGDLFAPLASLNRLRRDILAKAEDALLNVRRPTPDKVAKARDRLAAMSLNAALTAPEHRVPSLAVYADSLETVQGAADAGCHRIYFEPFLRDASDRAKIMLQLLQDAKAICPDAELIWKWPKITRADYLNFAGPLLAKADVDAFMVEGVGAAGAVLAARPKAKLYGASGLNVWNHLAVQQFSLPFQLLTLSPELSAEQLAKTVARSRLGASESEGAPMLELVVQGSLEVMVAEDCIPCLAKTEAPPSGFWGLQDFKRIFPLRLDDDVRTHIFNSAETCLLDWMPKLFEIGLDGLAVDARGRTKKYARKMTEIYLEAVELTEKGDKSLPRELESLKELVMPMALGGITSGHFIKGLK